MNVEYLHASKFGNGAAVAEEFKKHMVSKGVTVNVRHVREVSPKKLPPADLYLFSSPGRFGKPIRDMRRTLEKLELPQGTRYALLATELDPQAARDSGETPQQGEPGKCQRVLPVMNDILRGKGLVEVAEDKIHVTGLRGPLEEGWREKVDAFADMIS